jgi:hypothetical protein
MVFSSSLFIAAALSLVCAVGFLSKVRLISLLVKIWRKGLAGRKPVVGNWNEKERNSRS